MRKPFVCGNWKLHHDLRKTQDVIDEIVQGLSNNAWAAAKIDLAIAPVVTVLFAACEKTKNTPVQIAAQNVFFKEQGAFTGEWSVQHLVELGCKYAIVGHSERRQYFNETNESVALKTRACFAGGLTPIVCVGESEQERDHGDMRQVLENQLAPVLDVVDRDAIAKLIVAYEPIWAIGTGKNATAKQAEEVHSYLRSLITNRWGQAAAQQARIIYGGSVKPENVAELIEQENVDGALVGGASLSSESFLSIVREAIV